MWFKISGFGILLENFEFVSLVGFENLYFNNVSVFIVNVLLSLCWGVLFRVMKNYFKILEERFGKYKVLGRIEIKMKLI